MVFEVQQAQPRSFTSVKMYDPQLNAVMPVISVLYVTAHKPALPKSSDIHI